MTGPIGALLGHPDGRAMAMAQEVLVTLTDDLDGSDAE
jgi:hypothetical protein